MQSRFVRHMQWPRSLRWQFALVLAIFALLIIAGSLTAIYTLRMSADTARVITEQGLMQVQQVQKLIRDSLLIERETLRMLAADSPDDLQATYAKTIIQLNSLDNLVTRLGGGRADTVAISLHQSGQVFRNTVHIMVQLHESTLRTQSEFDKSIHSHISRLQNRRDDTAQKLISILHRLGQAERVAEVDALRNQFIAQSGNTHLQTQTAYQNPPSALDEANEAPPSEALSPFILRIKLIQQQDNLRHFREELQRQVSFITTTAQELSERFTGEHQKTVKTLSDISQRTQFLVLGQLAACLILGLLVARYFIGQHILARIQKISDYLQQSPATGGQECILIQGEDEIGNMARAIEKLIRDQRQLAEAQWQLLQADKISSVAQLAGSIANKINPPIKQIAGNLSTTQEYTKSIFSLLACYEANENEFQEKTRTAIKRMKRDINTEFLRDDVNSLLNQTESSVLEIRNIAQQLKDYSHQNNADKQLTNLEQALDRTLNLVAHKLTQQIKVHKEYAGIPEVECVPSRLNQVFLNLVMNAAHAIGDRGCITLRTARQEHNVLLEVEDDGCGIAPEALNHIFAPFSPDPANRNAGFSLPMVYDIIQEHGGTISARNKAGKGTVFRITLPIKQPP